MIDWRPYAERRVKLSAAQHAAMDYADARGVVVEYRETVAYTKSGYAAIFGDTVFVRATGLSDDVAMALSLAGFASSDFEVSNGAPPVPCFVFARKWPKPEVIG